MDVGSFEAWVDQAAGRLSSTMYEPTCDPLWLKARVRDLLRFWNGGGIWVAENGKRVARKSHLLLERLSKMGTGHFA